MSGGVTKRVQSAKTRGEAAARRAKEWSDNQHPTSRPGVLIDAWKRYRDAEGPVYALVFTAYGLIALLPTVLVVSTFVRSDPTALADRLDKRLKLDGATDRLLHEVLSGASGHKFIALIIAIGSVFISSLGFGKAMQKVCAAVWRQPPPADVARSQIRCQVWFITLLAAVTMMVVVNVAIGGAGTWLTYVLAPVWAAGSVAFFTWTPGYLLDRPIPLGGALAGGLATGAGLLILQVLSAIVLSNWLNWYSKYYGSLGIVLAMFFWLLLANTAIVLGSAFGGAYAERHKALKHPAVESPAAESPAVETPALESPAVETPAE